MLLEWHLYAFRSGALVMQLSMSAQLLCLRMLGSKYLIYAQSKFRMGFSIPILLCFRRLGYGYKNRDQPPNLPLSCPV